MYTVLHIHVHIYTRFNTPLVVVRQKLASVAPCPQSIGMRSSFTCLHTKAQSETLLQIHSHSTVAYITLFKIKSNHTKIQEPKELQSAVQNNKQIKYTVECDIVIEYNQNKHGSKTTLWRQWYYLFTSTTCVHLYYNIDCYNALIT